MTVNILPDSDGRTNTLLWTLLALLAGYRARKQWGLWLALALMLTSLSTRADEPAPFYLEANLGRAISNWNQGDFDARLATVSQSGSLTHLDDKRFSWQLLGGYRLNSWLGAEAGWLDWGETKLQVQAVTTNPGGLRALLHDSYPVSGQGPYVGARFSYFNRHEQEFFLRSGLWSWQGDYDIEVGSTRETVKKDGLDLLLGAGVNLPVTDQISAGMTLQWAELNDDGQIQLGLQVAYRF